MHNQIIKYIVALLFLATSSTLSITGQIGINTENPQDNILVHIDPLKNNAKTGTITAAQTADDIVVTATGSIGIGTINPTTKLHVVTGGTATSPNPQFSIEDGYQAINRVLTSDANGIGHWEDYVPGAILGTFDTHGVEVPVTEAQYKNTKAKITLDPGKWLVFYAFTVECNNVDVPYFYKITVRSTLGDITTLNSSSTYGMPTSDIKGETTDSNIVWANIKGVLTSRYIIDNTSGDSKDYYLLVGDIENSGSVSTIIMPNVGKNSNNSSFYAFRINES